MTGSDHPKKLTEWIREKALELGFSACGFSRSEKLEKETDYLREWLGLGHHGDMSYMERNADKRTDPGLILEGARSVISVLLNYFPGEPLPVTNNYRIARYAYGRDYHEEIRERLNVLIGLITEETGDFRSRAFTDSAPVLDKAWAERAGLGWIGKNTCLIHPKIGSFVFVGEIITDLELEPDLNRVNDLCGGCTRCLDACPTGAITGPRVLDARKCISYLTIEYKGELPAEEKGNFRDWIFGCDICQEVCPWNRAAGPHRVAAFNPSEELRKMDKEKWHEMDREQFQRLFKGSAVKRAGFEGLKRNIRFLEDDKEIK